MKTERYRLYIAPFNADTVQFALDEPYSRATETHVMIYKRGKGPNGYKELPSNMVHLLPAQDRKWIMEINILLMRQFVKKNREKEERAGRKFVEEFEKELEKEREKMRKGSGDDK